MKVRKYLKLIIFISVLTVCAVVVMELYSMKPAKKPKIERDRVIKKVLVETAKPDRYQPVIKVFGVVEPVWETVLKSEINGKVSKLSDAVKVGNRVKGGESLIELEREAYIVSLREAELRLENAKVAYQKEERKAQRARSDWENSGIEGKPYSPLVFHIPQLKEAESEIKAAEASIAKASLDLSKTVIKAPFNGLVAERHVSRGDVIFAGNEIIKIISIDDIEIKVGLNAPQIKSMGDWRRAELTIENTLSGESWRGKIVRTDGYLNSKTRQQGHYIVPLETAERPLPGTFTTIKIKGEEVDDILSLNESSLTRDGYVWYADKKNKLKRIKADVLFYDDKRIYIRNNGIFESFRAVVTPVRSFIEGAEVNPVEQERQSK